VDQANDSNEIDQVYRLLALCARAEGHPVFYEQLARQINQFTAWQELPSQANLHGMASLLWHHVHKSGLAIPDETEHILKGLYLRQRSINQTYALALTDITSLFEKNGIRALVLKGLALAYQYYPDPALRHLSDIDLLLEQKDILRGLHLLSDAGFSTRFPDGTLKRVPSELAADSPPRNGICVHVELHHYDPGGRFAKGNSPDPEFEDFTAPHQALTINNNIVYTPAPMEMLHYLSRHLTKHLFIANSNNPIRIKWIADIISLVEYHAEEFDWKYLQQHHTDILNRLEVFYSMTPLSEHYAKIIPVKQVPIPTSVNHYPPGWPHQSIRQWKQVGFLRFAWRVAIPPSDWWIRLYYGVGKRPLFWYKQFIYRMQILMAIFWTFIHKMGR
jgi:hypothetical protein